MLSFLIITTVNEYKTIGGEEHSKKKKNPKSLEKVTTEIIGSR